MSFLFPWCLCWSRLEDPSDGNVSFCLLFFWLFGFQMEHDKGKLHFWTLTSALNWMWSLNISLFDCIQREACQRHPITLWLQGYPLLIKKSFLKKFWLRRTDRGQTWGRKAHCSRGQRQGINFPKSAFPRQLFKSGKKVHFFELTYQKAFIPLLRTRQECRLTVSHQCQPLDVPARNSF